MKTGMMSKMVALNNAEMEKVIGGYKQSDINLLVSSPTHIGKTSEKSIQEK